MDDKLVYHALFFRSMEFVCISNKYLYNRSAHSRVLILDTKFMYPGFCNNLNQSTICLLASKEKG